MEKTAALSIDGMSCAHCTKAVMNALNAIRGVKSVEVSLVGKSAKVVYDEELTGLSELESAIIEEGYQVKGG